MDHPTNAAVTTGVSGSEVGTKWTRRVLPAALSSVLPGAGQLWLGKKKTGVAFLGAFCLLTLLYWPVRLPNMVRRNTGFALHRDGSMRDSGMARSTSAEPGKSAVLSLVACSVYTARVRSFLRT